MEPTTDPRPETRGGARARRSRTIALGATAAAALAAVGGVAGHAVATAANDGPRAEGGISSSDVYRTDDGAGYRYDGDDDHEGGDDRYGDDRYEDGDDDGRDAGRASPWAPSGSATPGRGSSSNVVPAPDTSSRAS